MTKRLAGKVALITGGSRGLGRGIAEAFAGEGANIVVNYVKDSAAADAVVAKVKALGGDAIAIKADVGDDFEKQMRRAYQLAFSRDPRPDEIADAEPIVNEFGLATLCRVLFNSNEFLFVP